jgi:hypothetical protein
MVELAAQGQTIRLFGPSHMDPSMLLPLWLMVAATKFWFAGSLLARARAKPAARIRQGLGAPARRRVGPRGRQGRCRRGDSPMSYLAYVAAAYAVFAVVMAWDFLAPRRSIRRQLRACACAKPAAAPPPRSRPMHRRELRR